MRLLEELKEIRDVIRIVWKNAAYVVGSNFQQNLQEVRYARKVDGLPWHAQHCAVARDIKTGLNYIALSGLSGVAAGGLIAFGVVSHRPQQIVEGVVCLMPTAVSSALALSQFGKVGLTLREIAEEKAKRPPNVPYGGWPDSRPAGI